MFSLTLSSFPLGRKVATKEPDGGGTPKKRDDGWRFCQ
jgi:hypothetical protein